VPIFLPIVTEFLVLITTILDVFAATIVAISVFQALISSVFRHVSYPFSFLSNRYDIQIKNSKDHKVQSYKVSSSTRNLIRGLLLGLEFESASAIIKLGIFMTNIIISAPMGDNINDFLFFSSIITLRIIINQSLRRFNII
jgi:hypothetical protein